MVCPTFAIGSGFIFGIQENSLKTLVASQYPVMEAFYTLQGEGFHQGKAAYFIRLGGCDVGCVWCDVKESWDVNAHPKMLVESIVNQALEYPARLAVITGGEPLMHDCGPLSEGLKEAGFQTNIETSAAYPLSGSWDWICVSPKKFKAPLPEVLVKADEYKVVVFHKSDLEWMMQFVDLLPAHCQLYLQPEWSKSESILPLLVDFAKANPRWRVTLQSHKYMNIP